MNIEDSTDGICDECEEPVGDCDCDIICQSCEDLMPRKHKCADPARVCDFCEEPIDACHCQGSDHYD